MALTIKRTKFGLLTFGVLALSGFLLAPPQWPSLAIATLCGVLSGAICARAGKEGDRYAKVFAIVVPATIGRAIVRNTFFREAIGRTAWGFEFQFTGVAFLVGFGMILAYLVRQHEKKTG